MPRASKAAETAAMPAAMPAATLDEREADRRALRLWLHLMKASKVIEGEISRNLRRAYGQSLSRFDVLSQLYRAADHWLDGWIATGALADQLMTGSGNITALIDRMESEGLVERRPSPDDRRSHQVRMTPNGRALFLAMTEDHAGWVSEALKDISDREKDALTGLLIKVRRAFEPVPAETHTKKDRP